MIDIIQNQNGELALDVTVARPKTACFDGTAFHGAFTPGVHMGVIDQAAWRDLQGTNVSGYHGTAVSGNGVTPVNGDPVGGTVLESTVGNAGVGIAKAATVDNRITADRPVNAGVRNRRRGIRPPRKRP